ncbi:WD40 repeat domain-containing protein [Roseimicrobium sp. ORNL1]|uniref:WD40 repeat domain-containing protein n=1 Tax=Roseimicrobium sp. ORNL1 TaxID=2711231 RepID=UPI0013E19A70|nr:WD40 repeat domain-containing protein [Roseimicrobium sp. ORNL1]QIF03759.1 WD40 repeat domain-containing protein [Roseimicrobium sp. ORNL1]
MILRTLTIASLLLAHGSLPAQKLEAIGTKPAPLNLIPPSPKAKSLLRWLGHEGASPEDEIGRAEWTPDGSRLLTSGQSGTASSIRVWRASDDRKSLSLEGSFMIGESWAISPDGKRIVGNQFGDLKNIWSFQMFDLDTLEGIWTTSARVPNMLGSTFSRDGKWLAVLNLHQRDLSNKRDYSVTILEADTGKHVETIRLKPDDGEPSNWQHHKMAFTKEALWIAPAYNEDGQTARISISDWKKTFVSEPESDEYVEKNLIVSADGKWIVLWGGPRYRAMQMVGDRLAVRFEGQTEYSKYGGPFGFASANISPDSRLLTVSGNGKHKVIDLEDRKVVHEDNKNCLCGLFSPDGKTLWGTCNPFRPIDTKSWKPPAETVPGHRGTVQFVSFSPDGKFLASQDAECIYIWSVDGSAPPRKLMSPPDEGKLYTLEWKPDGTEVWSANAPDFIRWRLSETVPPGTPQYAEKLFPGLKPGKTEVPWMKTIKAVPGTDLCYLSVAHMEKYELSYQLYEELRSPSKPAVVKPVMGRVLLKGRLPFSSSGEEIFDIEDNTLTAFKWTDGAVRKGMSAQNTSIAGGGANGPLVLTSSQQITLVDPATLQQIRAFMPPKGTRYSGGLDNLQGGCISRDGQWFVCSTDYQFMSVGRSPEYLVNIKGNGEAYPLPPMDNKAKSGAFSPDGRLLAIGHAGGLVSLWDVEKIRSESGPVPTEAPKSMFSSMKRYDSQKWDWPGPGLALKEGGKFTFTDDGGVECKEVGTVAGQLLIDGKPPKALRKVVSGMAPQGGVPDSLFAELDLRSDDGKTRLNRNIACSVRGSSRWQDTVENLSAEPVTVTLTYSSSLGSDLQNLRDRDSNVPTTLPDGTLKSSIPITELGTVIDKDGNSLSASLAFSTPSASVQPALKWDATGRRVVKEWTLKLQPFEKRILLMEFVLNPTTDRHTLHKLTLANRSLLPRLSAVLNFVPDEEEKRFLELDYPNYDLDTDGTKKDGLGFKWRPEISSGFGMAAEMGADRFFDIWLNGAPGMGSTPGLARNSSFRMGSTPGLARNPSLRMGPRLSNSTDGKVQSKRRHHFVPEIGMLLMHDEITNTGTEESNVEVLFNTVALDRFVQVVDAKGKILNCNSPLKFKDSGGQVALISEGTTKPALLLAFGSPEGKVHPSFKLVAGRGFFVGYNLRMKAGETISLLHIATQRPFSAYDSAASAFLEMDSLYALDVAKSQQWPAPANW